MAGFSREEKINGINGLCMFEGVEDEICLEVWEELEDILFD